MYVTVVRHCGMARGIMLWNLQILQFELSQMGTARHQFRSTIQRVVSVKQDMELLSKADITLPCCTPIFLALFKNFPFNSRGGVVGFIVPEEGC